MKLLVDSHTHTVLSGHAFSTVLENITFAAKHGLEGMVTSDHGPAILGAGPDYVFNVMSGVEDYLEGVRLFKGVEANITDAKGNIDIRERYLKKTEFAIASMHEIVIEPRDLECDTQALLSAMKNPYIDIIGHPGNPAFQIDAQKLVKAAKDNCKLLEINNHSFVFRPGSGPNCLNIIRLCKKWDVRICVGSDAHICSKVGKFGDAINALCECGFPKELIVSRNLKSFEEYIAERKNRLKHFAIE